MVEKKRKLTLQVILLIIFAGITFVYNVIVHGAKDFIIQNTSMGITTYNYLKFGTYIGIAVCIGWLVGILIRSGKLIMANMKENKFIADRKTLVINNDKIKRSDKSEVNEILDSIAQSLHHFNKVKDGRYVPTEFVAVIDELTEILHGTSDFIIENPDKLRNLRKFVNYYLPVTDNYMKTYANFNAKSQKLQGNNIKSTLRRIEEVMAEITAAYRRTFDDLFSDKAMDILSEIQVTKAMMKEDGEITDF
ncbi:MAG: 5-bromo-4-chloroindolyl phosphate hydrolysis family protein [Oscillospiraceae bacterium]|nr:5-bromo-4-chloroindolyl phosphate hydrolysis family protein [Oscillospiraceae bacterium]